MTRSSDDPYAHLRANAAAQKQTTVDRLVNAIAQLEAEGREVSTFTIKEISGMDYMTYYRNREAFNCSRSTAPTCARNVSRNRRNGKRLSKETHEKREKITWSRCHRAIPSSITNARAWSNSYMRPKLNVTRPDDSYEQSEWRPSCARKQNELA